VSNVDEGSCFQDYEHYKEYRDLLIDGEQKVSEGLDKAILAISSAALGLTFTFGKSLIGTNNLVEISWLKSSWLFLGLSLFSVLVSLSMAGFIYHLNRKQCDLIMENRSEIISKNRDSSDSVPNKIEFNDSVHLKNINFFFHFSSPVFLIAGGICIGMFFNLNLGVKFNEPEANTSTTPSSIRASVAGEKNSNTTTSTASKTSP
jgi:hypothetical protein